MRTLSEKWDEALRDQGVADGEGWSEVVEGLRSAAVS